MAITLETELITPDTAREYMQKNTNNRPLSRGQVEALARDIREGLWRQTHQGIAFDIEGNLADGQHRLAAIIEAETPIYLLVARGVPLDAKKVLDVGRKRTVGDMLAMDGVKNTMILASIARIGLIYDQKDFSSKGVRSVTAPQVYAYAHEHLGELGTATYRTHTLKHQIPTTTAVIGSAFYLFHRVDVEATEQFFNAIANMRTNGEGDPRLALMRRLNGLRMDRESASTLHVLDLFIRAWNWWRLDREVAKLPLTRTLMWTEIS